MKGFINATIVTPIGKSAVKGTAMGCLTTINNGAVAVSDDGIITYVGDQKAMPACGETVDLGGVYCSRGLSTAIPTPCSEGFAPMSSVCASKDGRIWIS